MAKVSFDFDSTLSRKDVQDFAKELIAMGIEVWIVTTRYDSNHRHKWNLSFPGALWASAYVSNDSDPNFHLWGVAEWLGIPRHHVRFTCMEYKYTYLDGTKFLWHLDDNEEEFSHARTNGCSVPMIHVNSEFWMEECERLIEQKLNT
jgi:hypothetical protein